VYRDVDSFRCCIVDGAGSFEKNADRSLLEDDMRNAEIQQRCLSVDVDGEKSMTVLEEVRDNH